MYADGISINKAADAYGIPRSTLKGRIHGSNPRKEHDEARQKLTPRQERKLRDWILIQHDLGCPVSHLQVRDFASKVAVRNGFQDGVGKNWLEGFLTRFSDVKTLKGKKIDSDRYHGASTELIKAFFMLLMMPPVRKIKQKHRYNVDEVGMMEGIGLNGLVLGRAEKKSALLKQPGSRYWISILECISATGRVLKPLVIFKGRSVQQQWFPYNIDFLEDWNFTCSEKGWTNNQIALQWLRNVFIPETAPKDPREPRLLILDGHGSHMTEDFLFECYDNNIYLLFLIPHSSHVLQPLDVAVFGPLKNAYRRHLSDLSSIADSTPIGKITFLVNYHKARIEAITKDNIIAGWKASGLYPVSVARALMNPMVTETLERPRTPSPPAESPSECPLRTPRSTVQVKRALDVISLTYEVPPVVSLLMRKMGHRCEDDSVTLEQQAKEISILKHQNEELRPKKRKKVVFNGNAEFAKVPAIKKAREAMLKITQPRRTAMRVSRIKQSDLEHTFHLNLH